MSETKHEVKPILTDIDYEAALVELEKVFDDDGDYVEALVEAIEAYENEHYPMPPLTFRLWLWVEFTLFVAWMRKVLGRK